MELPEQNLTFTTQKICFFLYDNRRKRKYYMQQGKYNEAKDAFKSYISTGYKGNLNYEDALAYVSEAASIDGSAKNKELYANLASIVRKQRG